MPGVLERHRPPARHPAAGRSLRIPAEEYRTEGNELLGAWGKLGRDMQALLLDSPSCPPARPVEQYDDPSADTALGAVQRDILDLRLASEAKAADPVPSDDSIQIHVCHSAMREAEVLHDRLLGLFDANPDVQPADVLVLTPNIVDYAPAIEAVFGAADVIPFNIARPRASATRAVQAFLDLLALPDSRYGAEAVMAPLESKAVSGKFRIAERQLSTLREWVDQAGIRWGIDADHREDEGLPRFAGHAWRQGIDRLLLGYAMDGETAMFKNVAPSFGGLGRILRRLRAPGAFRRLLRRCDGTAGARGTGAAGGGVGRDSPRPGRTVLCDRLGERGGNRDGDATHRGRCRGV